MLWISSTTTKGGFPPFIGPYGAAKAAMDSLAVSLAYEIARFGIETSIVVPGAFTRGTAHFPSAGKPADAERAAAYARYDGVMDQIGQRLSELTPDDADPQAVADEIVRIVGLPSGDAADALGDRLRRRRRDARCSKCRSVCASSSPSASAWAICWKHGFDAERGGETDRYESSHVDRLRRPAACFDRRMRCPTSTVRHVRHVRHDEEHDHETLGHVPSFAKAHAVLYKPDDRSTAMGDRPLA